jgi:hypothetical protein
LLASGSQYVGLQFQYGIKFFYIFFIHYDVIASASLVFGLPPQFNAGPPVLLAHGFIFTQFGLRGFHCCSMSGLL